MNDHETYGGLAEGVHLTAYVFERACANLESLLEGDRWRLGGRFRDPNEFLDSLLLDKFRPLAESRKRISLRIKELQPAVSNRQIERTLGGRSRYGQSRPWRKSATVFQKVQRIQRAPSADRGNPPPRALSGAQAANLVERRETGKAERLAKVAADEQRVLRLALIVGKFRTLLIDPGWDWDWLSRAVRAKAGYAMQTRTRSCSRSRLKQWADEAVDRHLFCWTTNNLWPALASWSPAGAFSTAPSSPGSRKARSGRAATFAIRPNMSCSPRSARRRRVRAPPASPPFRRAARGGALGKARAILRDRARGELSALWRGQPAHAAAGLRQPVSRGRGHRGGGSDRRRTRFAGGDGVGWIERGERQCAATATAGQRAAQKAGRRE